MLIHDLWRKTFLWHCCKIIKLYRFNKKNSTYIHSYFASLKANYGEKVMISQGTRVASDVTIGDYSYVNINSSLENCIIGKFCSISSGVYISPWEHDLHKRTTHPIAYDEEIRNKVRKKVKIGHDVLISLNCIILEGITIGNGAVIGAGAVVTKDVLPYEIVAGVPAKHIGFRFDKNTITDLNNIKWWDWDISKINRNLLYLQNKTDYINEKREN